MVPLHITHCPSKAGNATGSQTYWQMLGQDMANEGDGGVVLGGLKMLVQSVDGLEGLLWGCFCERDMETDSE